jgi:mRNA interferase HigB
MRIVKRTALQRFGKAFPRARTALSKWSEVATMADWKNIQDVRRVFPHADAAKVASGNTVTVFNVCGNEYRLVVAIKYRWGMIYVRDFLTHAQYSKGDWKGRH